MRKSRLLLLLPVLLLGACSRGEISTETKALLENPLYAEWYYNDIVDDLTTLAIRNDPMLKDAARKAAADAARKEAAEKSREVVQQRQKGRLGQFRGPEQIVEGKALLLGDTLFFGPDFLSIPGPELHVYLSEMLDPREAAFPDASVLDLGLLKSPYESQNYTIVEPKDLTNYRTVVLWDTKLRRLYAFAQLQVQ